MAASSTGTRGPGYTSDAGSSSSGSAAGTAGATISAGAVLAKVIGPEPASTTGPTGSTIAGRTPGEPIAAVTAGAAFTAGPTWAIIGTCSASASIASGSPRQAGGIANARIAGSPITAVTS